MDVLRFSKLGTAWEVGKWPRNGGWKKTPEDYRIVVGELLERWVILSDNAAESDVACGRRGEGFVAPEDSLRELFQS